MVRFYMHIIVGEYIMNPVKVKNIEIGTGMPKIIVPIVGVTKEEILTTARSFNTIPLDVVEWRADWFEGVFDFTQVEDVLKELQNILLVKHHCS